MKKLLLNASNLIAQALTAVLIFTVVITSCHKENPTVYGVWETVSGPGDKWEYTVQRLGKFCRALDSAFPNTYFCYDYEKNGNTLTVNSQQGAETWEWVFETETVALVTVTIPGNSPYTIVLRKK